MKKFLFLFLVVALLLSSCSKYEETSSLDGYDFSISSQDSSDNSQTSTDASSEESSDINEESSETTSEDTSGEQEESEMFDFSKLSKEELAQYVSLGEYKGLESEKYVIEVTDKEVEDCINEILKSNIEYVEITDRPVKDGDILTIDYKGYINGELFEGGADTNATLVIGENKFIDGFEEGLIGAKKGDTVSLNLKFPDNYYEELAGKDVVFEVNVKKIEIKFTPVLNEEFVQKHTDGEIKTVELYKEDIKKQIKNQKEIEKFNESKNSYWEKVLDNATVIKFPDGVIEEYIKAYIDYYTQMASIYGVTLEEFLGKPVDKFREESKKDAEESYKTQMVLYATIHEEGFDKNISDEKYHKWLADFSALLGVSKEQLVEQYSTETLKNTCLFDLFLDHIYQYRVEVEPSESTDSSSAGESTDSSVAN